MLKIDKICENAKEADKVSTRARICDGFREL